VSELDAAFPSNHNGVDDSIHEDDLAGSSENIINKLALLSQDQSNKRQTLAVPSRETLARNNGQKRGTLYHSSKKDFEE
jgi:hypothetical protein